MAQPVPSSSTGNKLNISAEFLGRIAKLRKVTISFVMSVCLSVRPSAWNNSAPTGWIFLKIFRKSVQKIQGLLYSYENDGCSHEDIYIYDNANLKSS